MIICGIKLTHDGAIALIDKGRLIFSFEMEKLANNPRYSAFCISMPKIEEILSSYGYRFKDIDQLVIDGWDAWDTEQMRQVNKDLVFHLLTEDNSKISIRVAGYGRIVRGEDNILAASIFKLERYDITYKSYKHVTGHVIGAYCTSPFAKVMQDSFILVWDGGMPPQFFYYEYKINKVQNLGALFPFMGYMYQNFSFAFEPFSLSENNMSIAGKAMAYMALGKVIPNILTFFRAVYKELIGMVNPRNMSIEIVAIFTHEFIKRAKEYCATNKIDHKHMLSTFHAFVQEILVEKMREKVEEYPNFLKNLCFTGGCALNIKWNSAIRDSRIFRQVFVPPFPNDSGSAIGTACCEMILSDNIRNLEWNVYSGPMIKNSDPQESEYSVRDCSLKELAKVLHEQNEPIVFLNESAELGPRALGNRSILAASVHQSMKEKLNEVKCREDYRPIAPICLEEDAANIFEPGTPDPYMLYEHKVRQNWKNKVPAICHLDGTARLQTVSEVENPTIFELLSHYKKLSGVPLLCNTSANHNGCGFFPDVESAIKWGRVNFIWNSYKLYYREKSFHKEKMKKNVVNV